MFTSILFDVGDTLVGYVPTTEYVIAKRLEKIGIQANPQRVGKIKKGMDLWIAEQILRESKTSVKMSDEDFFDSMDMVILSSEIPTIHDKHDPVFLDFVNTRGLYHQEKVVNKDAFPLLELLKPKYKLGIVSNYSASLLDYLIDSGLKVYFDSIVISGIVGVEKPDKAIMDIACKELLCNPQECLYVGDHPFDVLCAKEAGMSMAWLCSENDQLPHYIKARPDYRINSLMDLMLCIQ